MFLLKFLTKDIFIDFVHINWIVFLLSGSVDTEKETTVPEPKAAKETIDLKEIKRVDHILASLQRKVSWYTTFHCFVFKQLCSTSFEVYNNFKKNNKGVRLN